MKKKILLLALAVCLITLSIAGASLAYFTDVEDKTSVFTSGNVEIALAYDETEIKLYPGQTYEKLATIENTGSEKAYVGAIVDVILPSGVVNPHTFDAIAGIFDGLDAHTYKYEQTANGYKIYVVLGELDTADNAETTDVNEKTATVFEGLDIPADWDHREMAIFKDMTVKVTGYAVQTVGFEENGAAAALDAAFGNDGGAWKNYNNATAPTAND